MEKKGDRRDEEETEEETYDTSQDKRNERGKDTMGPDNYQKLGHDFQGNTIFDPDEPMEFNLFS